MAKEKKKHTVQYDRWGYFFIAPFFIVYTIFSLIPLLTTLGNSFFENYRVGLMTVGPDWIGLENFKEVLDISEENNIIKYTGNTVIMWILGFIPQIVISLILSVWFTDTGLRLKFQQFFKTIIYMPNLIMASAFAMLFFTLFSDNGPMNSIFMSLGWIQEPIRFLVSTGWTRTLVAAMNFLMNHGNRREPL